MLKELAEKIDNRSIRADGIIGVIIVVIAAACYSVKYFYPSVGIRMISGLVTLTISSIFISDFIGTLGYIKKYEGMKKSSTSGEITRTELENDLLNLKQSKGEIWFCVIVIAIFAIAEIVSLYLGSNLKWIDGITDIVAVAGIISAASKNHCNFVIRKYIENAKF